MNLGLVWRVAVLEFNSDGICSDSEQSLGSRADGSRETWAFFKWMIISLSWPFNVVLLWHGQGQGSMDPGSLEGPVEEAMMLGKEIPLQLGESCQQEALSSAVRLIRGLAQLKRATLPTVAEAAYKSSCVVYKGPSSQPHLRTTLNPHPNYRICPPAGMAEAFIKTIP